MSVQIQPPTTAGIYPEKFPDDIFFFRRNVIVLTLLLFLCVGFGLRARDLGAESLSEDELNKLQTVSEYRVQGLSGRNGEHPFLMKGLQTVSLAIAERLNSTISDENKISDEAALRFPTVIVGTLSILILFLLVSELFGKHIGLIAAVLWAVDPSAIGFNRIAKEDSFLLFFFLLGNYFFVRGQTAAERGSHGWTKYLWLGAASFGAMVASKYLPHMFAVSFAYHQIFISIPTAAKWRIQRARWLQIVLVSGVCFLIFNPTILIPDTWRQILAFSGEKSVSRDSCEFMGELYRNQMTAWLAGMPWTFYFVFILVKTPLLTLLFFFAGLAAFFRRRLGDGRYFIFFWAFLWFFPFTFLGGKFTRYFVVVEPTILIAAAIGFYNALKWLSPKISRSANFLPIFSNICFAVLIACSLSDSLSFAPHFRLYTNSLGGNRANAGFYFPHDEFYDAATREIVWNIAASAKDGAHVANETPALFEYYMKKAGREDLISLPLSDKSKISALNVGDYIVAARGRRYQSNDAYLKILDSTAAVAQINFDEISAAKIYQPNEETLMQIKKVE